MDNHATTDDTIPAFCRHYDGVLLISQGDRNGAFGTIFYLFVLNQLLYAERHNLQPWIHLNSVSRHIYDAKIHGDGRPQLYKFPDQLQATWDYYNDSILNKTYPYPGKPQSTNVGPTSIQLEGTGVWGSYFKAKIPLKIRGTVFKEVELTRPCTNLPILNLNTDDQLVRGLHVACPYCVRSWKYGGMPPFLKLPLNYQQWWEPMRHQGSRIVKTYYQPVLKAVRVASSPCMALHVRHSDKANKRDKIPLKAFLPYCQAFVEQGGRTIYLATDSSRAIAKIQDEWPAHVVQAMEWQAQVVRSPDATPVFDGLNASHHSTNQQVLDDIQAMAQCQWFLHGLSAVSEATIYTNPRLKAVNLEFYTYYSRHKHAAQQLDSDAPTSVEEFVQLLKSTGLS